MRRLTVVSVAYPLAPVGRDRVGGAEQVLAALDVALVRAGHRSIVLGVEGSQGAGDIETYPMPTRPLDHSMIAEQQLHVREVLNRLLAEASVDLVHMHGIDFHKYLPPPGPPVLTTLHLPLAWYPQSALRPNRPKTWLNCVSATQAADATLNACMLPVIANGVPVEAFQSRRGRRCRYALLLARICPEKGQHLALQAAHAADIPLLIGGEVFPYPAHQEYFAHQVEPLLDRRRRYLGPLGFERKRRLLAGARCVLIPSLAAETSSLVAMEAAAAGTPVIAFRSGALPDVVEHGRTGFVVDDVAGMVAALDVIDTIDTETCQSVARRRFDVEHMTDAYIKRYGELVGAGVSHAA